MLDAATRRLDQPKSLFCTTNPGRTALFEHLEHRLPSTLLIEVPTQALQTPPHSANHALLVRASDLIQIAFPTSRISITAWYTKAVETDPGECRIRPGQHGEDDCEGEQA
jgi:hypothetical protein